MQNPWIAPFAWVVAAAAAACGPWIPVREDVSGPPRLRETALARTEESFRRETPQRPPAATPRHGLAALEKQVLGVAPAGPDLAMPRAGPAALFAADDEPPLPAELATLEATRFAVESAGAACRGRPLPARRLSDRAMEQFGRTVLAVTLGAYEDPEELDIDRLNRIAAFLETGEINWDGLAWAYFTGHDRDRFAERTGERLSIPALGAGIPAETLHSAIAIGFAVIRDYALLSCGRRSPTAPDSRVRSRGDEDRGHHRFDGFRIEPRT